MLNRLLFKNQDKKQLVIAIIGAFLGITFLITSIHYLIKVNEFGEGNDILGPNTIIVQKKVTNLISKNDFTPAEIDKIQAEEFIQDVKPVQANNFDVSFETADPMVPYFRTETFIETVDPAFLDVKSDKWHWQEGDEFVPIIMPRDFLVMLNTFMSTEGIKQVSDELAMDVNFKFTLHKGDRKTWVNARIIGFSNQIAAILVPESFMNYGNSNFSNGEEKKITQVMIMGKENEFGLVEELLAKRGLETKNSEMVIGRLKSVVGTLFFVVLGISVIAVFVSGLVLIQYMQLLMSRNAYEVRTLMRIGYHPSILIRRFFRYFLKIFGIVAALGMGVFLLFKIFLDRMFESGGLFIDTQITFYSILALIISYFLFGLASYLNARKGIYREFN